MPSIQISDATFAGLQAIAKPFIDTPDAVIAKLLKSAALPPSHAEAALDSLEILDFAASNAPSLKFAVVKSYTIDGQSFDSGVYWSTLIADLLRACAKREIGPQTLAQAMKTPICVGQSDAAGYQFVAEAGVSFQQLNSDRSFEQAYLLGELGRIPFEVTWRWGNNAKAAYPGKMGKALVS
jgi:hypothetical protein